MVVLDNLRIGHGRMPYRGDRRILVAMGESVSASDLHPGLNGQASESPPVRWSGTRRDLARRS